MNSQFNESDDDLPLHPRGTRDEAYVRESERFETPDREVTLNTGVVLGIFFALALLCAVFFGFGYSIGHKSPSQAAAVPEPEITTSVESNPTPKASIATPQAVPGYVSSAGVKAATPAAKPSAAALPVERKATNEAPVVATAVPRPATEPRVEKAPVPVQVPSPAASGTIYVQVAAVSHQEDADVLTSALRRRGYAVHPRSDAADQLIHVQVGPFSTRKEADAMRQRLAGDGYNGFIK